MAIYDQRTCPICGNTFTATNPMQRYCSDACAGKSRRIYRTKYQRNYRAGKRGSLEDSRPLFPQGEEADPGETPYSKLEAWKAEAADSKAKASETRRRRDFLSQRNNPAGTITDEAVIEIQITRDGSLKFIAEDLDDSNRKTIKKKYNGGQAYQDTETGQYYRLVTYQAKQPTDRKPPRKLIPVNASEVYAIQKQPEEKKVEKYSNLYF